MAAELRAGAPATTSVLVTEPRLICSLATDVQSYQSGHAQATWVFRALQSLAQSQIGLHGDVFLGGSRRVRRQYSEQRADGRVVHVEAAPGVIIVLAASMLD